MSAHLYVTVLICICFGMLVTFADDLIEFVAAIVDKAIIRRKGS